jgi:hypothetical protein
MPSFLTIDQSYVNSYHANIELKYQQMISRLRSKVRVEYQNSQLDFYDRIGPTDVIERTTRYEDTPNIEVAFDRRAVSFRDFVWSSLIDKQDKLRTIADPASAYVMNAHAAMGRKADILITQACNGTAYSGQTGQTAVAFPTTQTIALGYVESGSAVGSNLTIGKLRKVVDMLRTAEAVEDDERINGVVAQNQLTSLLRTTEVTSQDFNEVKALAEGKVSSYMGIDFTRTQKTQLDSAAGVSGNVGYNAGISTTSGTTRHAMFFPQKAILMALAQDVMTRVTERADKNYAVQVYVSADFNATRMWEEQVVEVLCDETK